MNELTVFRYEDMNVRTIIIDGEPWLVGKDVAKALGYERASKAIQDHIEIEDKDEVPIQDSIGRMQEMVIINESGLYSLILSSKLPSAKKFKRWVTSEVLPSIRKTGSYSVISTETVIPTEKVFTTPTLRLGEVVELAKTAIKLMEKQNARPHEITYTVVKIMEQFGVTMPENMLPPKYLPLAEGSVKAFLQHYGEVNYESSNNVYVAYLTFCHDRGIPILDKKEVESQIKSHLGATIELRRADNGGYKCWVYVY